MEQWNRGVSVAQESSFLLSQLVSAHKQGEKEKNSERKIMLNLCAQHFHTISSTSCGLERTPDFAETLHAILTIENCPHLGKPLATRLCLGRESGVAHRGLWFFPFVFLGL